MILEKNRLRIVLDTNIYISAILFGGIPAEIVELARKKKLHLIISPSILLEFARILQVKFQFPKKIILDVISEIKRISEVIYPRIEIDKIKKDTADNRILECAISGRADYIVTGDKKHLRSLNNFEGISIKLPNEFIKEI